MSTKLSIAYLTGSAKVISNSLNSDEFRLRDRRTVGQMFFQPYESKKEYIFCARHTFSPMILIGIATLNPISMLHAPLIIGGIVIGAALFGGISTLCGNKDSASFFFDVSNYLIMDFCQAMINLVLLPVSALAMLTRGVSTGLQATGIYDYDASEEDFSAPPTLA